MSEWQPIETAPMDGTTIDLWVVCNPAVAKWNNLMRPLRYADMVWKPGGIFRGGWYFKFGSRIPLAAVPTHWMPLPSAPNKD